MKTIYLIRHAKSSWKNESQDDFDRPLSDRGGRDAPLMAAAMYSRNEVPDLLISSSAIRAKQTAEHFAKHFAKENPEFQLEDRLYLAGVGSLLEVICLIEDRINSVAVFAHNPGISAFVEYLSTENIDMPTTGIVRLDFGLDSWKELSGSTCMFKYFDYPKKHIVF